jgi:hypothetical protein
LPKNQFATLPLKLLGTIFIGLSALSFTVIAQNNKNTNTNNVYTPQGNQANNIKGFGGFYTQLGLGYQSFSPNLSNSNYTVRGTTYGSNTQVSSAQNIMGTVTAGYDLPINSGFLMGVGAELSPVSGKSTSIGGSTIGGVNIPPSSYKVNNTYNLFISPIFPIDKTTALYGKAGYSKANISAGPNLDSLGYSGYSLGLGYKTIITGNFYAYIEGNYYNYGKINNSGSAIIPGTSTSYGYSNSSTATSYNLLYGIGIRF